MPRDIEYQISQFIDNELPEQEQKALFAFLAENAESRKLFADYLALRAQTRHFYEHLNFTIPDQKKPARIYRFGHGTLIAAIAALIILAFLAVFQFWSAREFKNQNATLQAQLIRHQADYQQLAQEKEKLNQQILSVQEKIQALKSEPQVIKAAHKPVKSRTKLHQSAFAAVNPSIIKITENDFLGPKIIGN